MRTLAVDIGGSKIKAMVLDPEGNPVTERERKKTPQPATPDAVLGVILELASHLGDFDRVSVGFPGAVRNGVIETAPNLDPSWYRVDLQTELAGRLGRPARVANDATVQGYGAVTGQGVELVLTLGTGLGATLFLEGRPLPNFELAHHPFLHGKTYEELLGRKALERDGKKKWNQQVEKALAQLYRLFYYDSVAIGGGNTEHLTIELPANARIIPNISGILGGVRLWEMDERDAGVPVAV
ncbi:MAG: ROK family protein [Bryobacterales bacterium]|jgi:polyphosphate glucokinase|nr:ROK family protein [Bryobacterales bacterium]